MYVYITDMELFNSKPLLLGIRPEDGSRVAIHVNGFRWPLYLAPSNSLEKDAFADWTGKYIFPVIDEHKNTYGLENAGEVMNKTFCFYKEKQTRMHCFKYKHGDRAREIARKFDSNMVRVYHDRLDPILTFMHATNVRCFATVELTEAKQGIMGDKAVRSGRVQEWSVKYSDIRRVDDYPTPSFRVACYDLETDGLDPKVHEIRMIGLVFRDFPWTDQSRRAILLSRHPMAEAKEALDFEVRHVPDELTLITQFAELVDEEKSLILTGWNIAGFDNGFLSDRIEFLKKAKIIRNKRGQPEIISLPPLQKLSWLDAKRVDKKIKTLQTSAYGHNDMTLFTVAGLVMMDGMLLARKQLKLERFTLAAAAQWAGTYKGDMPYKRMLEAFISRDENELLEVAKYCVQDCDAVFSILARMEEPVKVCAVSTMAGVPPRYVIDRGVQVLVWSLIVEKACKSGFVMDQFPNIPDTSYEGATVLEPKIGYYADPLCILDFKSLYPSCMVANNVCPTRLHETLERSYDELVRTFEYPQYKIVDVGNGRYTVFQRLNDDMQLELGVIPLVLQSLLQQRQEVKRQAAIATDPIVRMQKTAREKALKVLANSIYGFTGARTSPLGPGAVLIAASVTSLGREALHKTKTEIETLREAGRVPSQTDIVYGDSVTEDTPLILRRPNGDVYLSRIDAFDGEWERTGDGKEFLTNLHVQVWTHQGFHSILRVYRHAVQKPIVRVVTRSGMVDCTSDHSLVRNDMSVVSPNDVDVGDELLHRRLCIDDTMINLHDSNIDDDKAWVMGAFIRSGTLHPWRIHGHSSCLEVLSGKLTFQTRIHPDGYLEASDDMDASLFYTVFLNKNGNETIPSLLLQSSYRVLIRFWMGYQSIQAPFPVGKLRLTAIWIFMTRLGLHPALSVTDGVVHLIASSNDNKTHTVLSTEPRDYHGMYVYDLETETSHFHVGPGDLIVHNTDSVMVVFPRTTREKAGELATFLSHHITKCFDKPMELEYETMLITFLLITKKRYAGQYHQGGGLLIKGIATQRRDYCRLVQDGIRGVLEALLLSTDGQGKQRAISFLDETLERIVQNKIPLEQLVVTKEINKIDYKSLPPHAAVAKKMESRDPTRPPKAGDRISYVVLRGTSTRIADRCDEVEYVRAEGLLPDMVYYAKQTSDQVLGLLVPAGLRVEGERVIRRGIQRAINMDEKQTSLATWGDVISVKTTTVGHAVQEQEKKTKQLALPAWIETRKRQASRDVQIQQKKLQKTQTKMDRFFPK